jgi:hypothetical protein
MRRLSIMVIELLLSSTDPSLQLKMTPLSLRTNPRQSYGFCLDRWQLATRTKIRVLQRWRSTSVLRQFVKNISIDTPRKLLSYSIFFTTSTLASHAIEEETYVRSGGRRDFLKAIFLRNTSVRERPSSRRNGFIYYPKSISDANNTLTLTMLSLPTAPVT